jgi:O-antigen ligase
VSAYRLLELAAVRIVGFEAKDLIGTQRLGFIYVIAFWLVYLDRQQKEFWGVARYPILFVLAVGLCLTFSRASIVATLVTFILFAVVQHGGWLKTFNMKSVGNAILTVIGAILIATAIFRVFPLVFQFFGARLFGFFVDSDALFNTFADSTTSEGTRLYIASRLLDFVVRNPLTGSGYLGAWVLRDTFGSAHGQYMDVLFRTGPIGFFIYLCMLVALMRFLWRSEEALFWGVAAVLVYGLFHETFKESQGAFVFAFLLGLMAQSWRDRRAARSRFKAASGSRRDLPTAPDPAFQTSETAARNS